MEIHLFGRYLNGKTRAGCENVKGMGEFV